MIVGIGGGVGASRLWRPLAGELGPERLTLVVNTGDDLWRHGLRICPDIDTTLYTLAGTGDTARGWGRSAETFTAMSELAELGEDVWFHLGDRDLGLHLRRSGRLAAGDGLTAITGGLAAAMGLATRVLPMTEHEVTTTIRTRDGRVLGYQEYFVRDAAAPPVAAVDYRGAEGSVAGPGVLEAIAEAELVVLGPSNPLASIAPVLAVPGIREALRASEAEVVAVTPIVSASPITEESQRRRAASRSGLLDAVDLPATATSAASLVADEIDTFLLDNLDAAEAEEIAKLGVAVELADTLPGGDLAAWLRSRLPLGSLKGG